QINRYVVENRGGDLQVASNVTPIAGETSLLVLKAQFTGGADTFSLFVNPTLGDAEPLTPDAVRTASIGLAQGLTVYSSGAFSLDEIRLGETFGDVTPIPEPAALAQLILAALALTALARRSVSSASKARNHVSTD
ncbi:MAG: hypothetical protein AAF961_11945, partial [Planctomycetota bacterium]